MELHNHDTRYHATQIGDGQTRKANVHFFPSHYRGLHSNFNNDPRTPELIEGNGELTVGGESSWMDRGGSKNSLVCVSP